MSQLSRFSISVFLLLFLLSNTHVKAQENFVVFFSAGIGLPLSANSFGAIPGIPNPGGLEFKSSANTLQPWFRVGGDMPVADKWRVGGALGITNYLLDYEAFEQTPIATEDGDIFLATQRHDLSMQFFAITIEPHVRYSVIDEIALNLAVPFSFPFTTDYTQTLRFTDPADLPFLDGSTELTTGRGTIEDIAAVVPGVAFSVEGVIPLDDAEAVVLVPSIGVSYSIGSWMKGASVRTVMPSLGIGVRYDAGADATPVFRDTSYVRDTVIILSPDVRYDTTVLANASAEEFDSGDTIRVLIHERYQILIPKPPAVLQVSMVLLFHADTGASSVATVTVTTVDRERSLPVVPAVVFDRNSWELPQRYWTGSGHWHYDVLNVIGARMATYPSAKIEVVAPNDTAAASVKMFLTEQHGIKKSRITTRVTDSETSSRTVHILSSSATIMEPLVIRDTISETTIPALMIMPEAVSEAGVASWTLKLFLNGDSVASLQRDSLLPETITWDVDEEIDASAVLTSQLRVQLLVTDNEGSIASSPRMGVRVRGPETLGSTKIQLRRTVLVRVPAAEVNGRPASDMKQLSDEESAAYVGRGLGDAERVLFKDSGVH